MYKNYKFLALMVIFSAVVGTPTSSLAEQPLGQFGVWEAFTENAGKNHICYMATEAIKARGNYKSRGKTYIMVTHRPAQNTINVVSVEAGYTYKKGSEVEIIIGKQTFKLFTSSTTAFTYDTKTDHALVKAMIKGVEMEVKGFSSRGTQTTDTYSLKGFGASYKSISMICQA
jgi:invasion protein IalB